MEARYMLRAIDPSDLVLDPGDAVVHLILMA